MKKFLTVVVCLFLVIMFGGFAPVTVSVPIENFDIYKFEGEVPHFFCHQLICDANLAFTKENNLRWHFFKDCATASEFKNFLIEMEKNNFVLVDIYDVYDVDDSGKAYKKDVFVPLGKKPFLLSLDDMSFDAIGNGLSDKIVLDESGNIGSYAIKTNKKIEYDKESIPILEQFVKENPHFAYKNARMVICPTGYNGILGYRITSENTEIKKSERESIKPLIVKLKQLGYKFASHTYNHINCAYSHNETINKDLTKYENEILSVVGKTNILSFPEGKWNNDNGKIKLLNEKGYKIFLCVGMPTACKEIGNSILIRRYCLDNSAFTTYKVNLQKYVDTQNIYDKQARDLMNAI